MMRLLLSNPVFANLTFFLVLVTGFLSYGLLPRQQDPDMNFNWISIVTLLPGGSATDVEKMVTDPLEDAIQKIPDVRFAMSSSQEGAMDILLRFEDMDDRTFDKRVNDLRREIANKKAELPEDATDPNIMEITSANGWPTVMLAVVGVADDENLRQNARRIRKDLERIKGVDDVLALGLRDPELQIRFHPEKLQRFGLLPTQLADLVATRIKDVSGGAIVHGWDNWLLRMEGTTMDMEKVATMTIPTPVGELAIGRVADVVRGRHKAKEAVRFQGKPSIMLTITKRPGVNSLELTDRIRVYLDQQKAMAEKTGVTPVLADDQTHMVRQALGTMESNALLGLFLVLVTTWLFLGGRIAVLVSLGVPFSLAGLFALLYGLDHSLNVMVLLGVVIALGMLVDDAVVVVESIYNNIEEGMPSMEACIAALKEVAAPVVTSVLTTVAAFLPLMLLPGILGKFMRVIPFVVTMALLISLVEALWMLPAHVVAMDIKANAGGRMHRWRTWLLVKLRRGYGLMLIKIIRNAKTSFFLAFIPFILAAWTIASGMVKTDFFASDPMPLFYINIKMPSGTPLEQTMATTRAIEVEAAKQVGSEELQNMVAYAGQMMTETKPFFGDRYGQILVSLTPNRHQRRSVATIIDAMRPIAAKVVGPESITFLSITGGPPVTRPVSVKVRGDDLEQIQRGAKAVKGILKAMPETSDVTDDFSEGSVELVLTADDQAMQRAGFHPSNLPRLVQLLGNGEVAARFQNNGEETEVRVMADYPEGAEMDRVLDTPLAVGDGQSMRLRDLVHHKSQRGPEAIRHYNFRRSITVEADLDKTRMDTLQANEHLKNEWQKIHQDHPGIDLDFSGILDDLNEAIDAIVVLFLFGIGLIFMILGAQFGNYSQPLIILLTVPMAFTGVVLGLLVSGHPLSLYTLYGVVALAGIAVNAAIVLISAANDRRKEGMAPTHAIIYAAKRRLVPILITTVTTIAGLFSLAVGMGGKSLLWGPVATAIVWGLFFSTTLSLFLMPLIYVAFWGKKTGERGKNKGLSRRVAPMIIRP
ncbi:MAG: efflux RND transporter permease subunit [Magnetococcales bacterium]|nr:efflux RND transporter permease subunit [Magnetococcales bacterium]HIJ85816.1 efflux RND transporter permease subunit [Magnetococcales bacterium]